MASTSASSIQKSFKYDVFLSFRGEDTRKNFVDHLYHALKQKGIYTYKDDDKIKKGKRISDELIRSIEDSKFYIIVFSKNYASSSWCLNELTKIMECQKENGHTAYPIFYDVEPTEIRKQSGPVGEAFAKHREGDDASKWTETLREAADLAGWELKNTLDGHEAKFIQKIVQEISLELRFSNVGVDGKLVGMKKRVKDVVSALEIDIDDVRMIGIKGIGGGGKTTLARVVFDQLSALFEGSSFIENVRENSKSSIGGLKSLQKQVLIDVLKDPHIIVNGVADGKNMMRKMMCGRKVLVVLDDVDHIDQLEALAGEPCWFKPGSRVIITTRDEQVLVARGVPKNLILDVSLLSPEEAKCLFNRYAFAGEIPNQGYEMLSGHVVHYAAGLPLTVRVLGSFLRGKDELEWTDELELLKTIPLVETLKILELSYNSLEEYQKEIFLDVACMLKGWKKERAIRALESCGFHARIGLKVLEQKSLITVSDSGCLSMHDHIEEMGKNIVRRVHPDAPYKHSRLWIDDEIEDILGEDTGTEETQCMKVKLVDLVIAMKGLRNMKKLRFLNVICKTKESVDLGYYGYDGDSNLEYDDIDEDWQYLPDGLRYLFWHGYPYKCLPKYFKANNLVGLEMHSANNYLLWAGEERKVLKKLRFIDLCSCKLTTLDIRLFPNLERLKLKECKDLRELHMPAENFTLKYLNICYSKLRALNLMHAQNLNTLKLQLCRDLVDFYMPLESLKLKHINIKHSRLKTLNLTLTQNIETLDLLCDDLVELHLPAESSKLRSFHLRFSKLRTLDIGRAWNLDNFEIHHNDYLVKLDLTVENLKSLWLRCPKLKTLNLTKTRNLEQLQLVRCEDLLELHMPHESLELKDIYITFSNLRTLDLTKTRNLEKLQLIRCEDLLELHMPHESPELKDIYITYTKLSTLDLTKTHNLEKLQLLQCEDLVELHMPRESLKLNYISIRSSKFRTLNFSQAQNLEKLDLLECENLQEVHMPFECPNLKTINMRCSNLRNLHLGQALHLESLDLHGCFNLEEMHVPVGCISGSVRFKRLLVNQEFPVVGSSVELHLIVRSLGICPLHPDNNLPKFYFEWIYKEVPAPSTQNLKKLILNGLSGTICGLQNLRKLTLEGSIPEVLKDLDQLECLEELSLLSMEIEHLPDAICMLKHLRFLQVKSCQNLKKLEDLGRLEWLKELHLTNCRSLRVIPNSNREIKRLKCCHGDISEAICGSQSLRKLTLEGSIPELPKELGQLERLEELSLLSTKIEHLPGGICMLKHLKSLKLKSCWDLKQLPEDLGRLKCLEELHLTDCTSLREIPNSICEMKHLKCLHLTNCILVVKLPEGIGSLKCLKELNIEGTSIIDLPDNLFELEDLVLSLG